MEPEAIRSLPEDDKQALLQRAVVPGIDFAGGYRFHIRADASALDGPARMVALGAVMNILRNRLDDMGIIEAVIRPSENEGIIVDVPISADTVLVRQLLSHSGLLTFQLFKEGEEVQALRSRIDTALAARDSASEQGTATPFSRFLASLPIDEDINDIVVAEEELPAVQSLLADTTVLRILQSYNRANPPAGEFVWADKPVVRNERRYYPLYFVKQEPDIVANPLSSAQVIEASAVTAHRSSFAVRVILNDNGRDDLTSVSSANEGKRLAIGVNKRIIMTLLIQGRIPNGTTEIPGGETISEAKALATALQSSVLPLAVTVSAGRPIGPLMEDGASVVQSGMTAIMAALGLVGLFVLIVYRASGAVALLAVLFHIIMTCAVLRLWIIAGISPYMTLSGLIGCGFTVLLVIGIHIVFYERLRDVLAEQNAPKNAVMIAFDAVKPLLIWLHIGILAMTAVFIGVGTGALLNGALAVFSGAAASLATLWLLTRTLYIVATSAWTLSRLSV